jgi:hypothetical protein
VLADIIFEIVAEFLVGLIFFEDVVGLFWAPTKQNDEAKG